MNASVYCKAAFDGVYLRKSIRNGGNNDDRGSMDSALYELF